MFSSLRRLEAGYDFAVGQLGPRVEMPRIQQWPKIANSWCRSPVDDGCKLDFAHSLGKEIEVVAPDKYVVHLKEGIECQRRPFD
jgi:hypothetical protein